MMVMHSVAPLSLYNHSQRGTDGRHPTHIVLPEVPGLQLCIILVHQEWPGNFITHRAGKDALPDRVGLELLVGGVCQSGAILNTAATRPTSVLHAHASAADAPADLPVVRGGEVEGLDGGGGPLLCWRKPQRGGRIQNGRAVGEWGETVMTRMAIQG